MTAVMVTHLISKTRHYRQLGVTNGQAAYDHINLSHEDVLPAEEGGDVVIIDSLNSSLGRVISCIVLRMRVWSYISCYFCFCISLGCHAELISITYRVSLILQLNLLI